MWLFIVVAVLAVLRGSTAPPTTRPTGSGQHALPTVQVFDYLQRYGYGGRPGSGGQFLRLQPATDQRAAVEDFQRFNGLPVTGEVDSATLELINTPRCGIPDHGRDDGAMFMTHRQRSYGKWDKTLLTYNLKLITSDLPADTVKHIFRQSFQFWSDVTTLNFREVNANIPPDIEIKFVTGSHGDRMPFDGRGGTLAHAFFPRYGGNAHFDDDERFSDGPGTGTNLLQVATHEIGHSLGLGHSGVRNAVMAPYYRGYNRNFKLQADDISKIQALYGRRPPSVTATPSTTKETASVTYRTRKSTSAGWWTTIRPPTSISPTNDPPTTSLCDDPRFDAIATSSLGTFVFRGNMMLKISGSGPDVVKISNLFTGFTTVDAAFAMTHKLPWQPTSSPLLFLFSGNHRAIYKMESVQYGALRATKQYDSTDLYHHQRLGRPLLFTGAPFNTGIDSVFKWAVNDKVYATKGNNYYRLDRSLRTVDYGYPRSLRVWRLPYTVRKVDAAIARDSSTYFFTGGSFYRYRDNRIMEPVKSIREDFLQCGSRKK